MSQPPTQYKPGDMHELTLPEGSVMRFRYIPKGEFRMGQRGGGWTDEEPVHRVVITDGFWLGETPVTQAQFAVWTKAEAIEHKNHFGDESEHPAENMDWFQALAFCEWLRTAAKETLPPEHGWPQLPSEAHWEYACRAGTETEYWSGDGEAALRRVGWYGANAGGTTQPVGEMPANAWGLHDMHGNVWEWCADVWDAAAYGKRPDEWTAAAWARGDAELGAEVSPNRVVRGGSWGSTAWRCRAADRAGREPSNRGWGSGFRVCLARSRPPAESSTGEAEPRTGGEPRKDDEVEPDGRGSAGGSGVDLSRERLPRA